MSRTETLAARIEEDLATGMRRLAHLRRVPVSVELRAAIVAHLDREVEALRENGARRTGAVSDQPATRGDPPDGLVAA
jgi:hypothetical protein